MEQSSGTSTQLGAAHTQARQSYSQDSSGRLSDVCCVCECVCVEGGGLGGGGECQSCIHAALGGWVMCVCVGGGGGSRGSRAINTHTAQKQ